MTRLGVAVVLVLGGLLVGSVLVPSVSQAQTSTSEIAIMLESNRMASGEDTFIAARAISGEGGAGEFQNEPKLVLLGVAITRGGPQFSEDHVCFNWTDEKWRVLGDGEAIPGGCELEPVVGGEISQEARWEIAGPEPVANESIIGDVDTVQAHHNFTVLVYGELGSDLVVGNVFQQATVTMQGVEEKDQLFAHKGVQPTDFEEFTELTALELLLFPLLTVLGIVIWSRSLDGAVRSFGALLPMVSGVLLLGFGVFVGLGEAWTGTAAFAGLMMLVGVYMFVRLGLDTIRGRSDGLME